MKRLHFCLTIAALVVVLLQPHKVYAATKFWKDSVPSGTFGTSTNWSAVSAAGTDNGGAPVAGEPVNIVHTSGVAHAVSVISNTPSLGLLSIDLTGPGATTNTLSISNHVTLTAAGIYVGGHNGTGFTNGRGTLTQSAGTIATSPGNDLYIGLGTGSTGVYNLSGGALNASLSTVVGSGGTGTFNHSGGTHTMIAEAIGGALLVGYLGGGNGTYNLSGTGQLIANKNEIIGVDGIGAFFQTGGSNTVSGSFVLHLGLNSGSQGTYNLSAGSLAVNNHQFIGYAGVGQFNQSGGTNTVANLVIADRATGQGAYAISGGTLTVSNNAQVGLLGTGSMNITGTGSAYITNDLAINNTSNVTLNGGTLRINTVSSGLNRLIFQSGTLQLAGNRSLLFDSTVANLYGATPTIASGRNLTVEGTAAVEGNPGGTVTVSNANFTSQGELTVGSTVGDGTLNINSGATVTNAGVVIADSTGSSSAFPQGTVNVNGGIWNTGGIVLGYGGQAAVNVTNGGYVRSSYVSMGFSDSSGNDPLNTALVSGPGSTWISDDDFFIGGQAESKLTIENGGYVYVTNELTVWLYSQVDMNGGTLRFNTLNLAGLGQVDYAGKLNYNGGTIQLAGARNLGGDAVIERYYGAIPTIPLGKGLTVEGAATLTKPLKIDGGTFKANGLSIGSGGSLLFQSGVLELSGGTISGLPQINVPTNGEFRAVGNHTVRIAGAVGSTITPTGLLVIGDFNAVNAFYTNGTVNVGANTLAITDANDAVFDSAAYVTLGNGASPGQLDALNGLTLNFGGNITGFGEVFTSNAIFTPLINNGHITGASSAQRISLPGYVKGVGTFDNVNFTGTFAPGLSPTSLVVGNIGFANSSTLVMELGGTSPGSGYDQILSSGALGLDGALQIALINGFNPTAGQSFNLFDWANVSGAFDSLSLPTLGGGLSWNTSQLYTTGVLSVSAGLPGDFELDGDVDGRDFLLWQRSPAVGNLADWQAAYNGGTLVAENIAVPEPSSSIIVLGLLVGAAQSCRIMR